MGKFSEGMLDVEIILKNLNIRIGQAILDAGCGNGYMARRFSELVGNTGKIHALDPNEGFIDDLKKEIGNQSNIDAFVGDITKRTGLSDASLDLVYLSAVFHLFSKRQIVGFENEINRILKPEGQLAIVNIGKEETPFGPPVEMRLSPEELRRELSFVPGRLVQVGEHFYMQLFTKE